MNGYNGQAIGWECVSMTPLWPIGTVLGYATLGLLTLIVVLLLVLLAVPFRLQAAGDIDDDHISGTAGAAWAWGFIAVRASSNEGASLHIAGMRVARLGADGDHKRKRKKRRKTDKRTRRRAGESTFGRWLDRSPLYFRCANRLLRSCRLRIALRGTVGLGDPADTALCIAFLLLVASTAEWAEVQVVPSYIEEALCLSGRTVARVWLGHMAFVILATVVLPLLHRAIRRAVSSGKTERHIAGGV
jgi:hypothetical protein